MVMTVDYAELYRQVHENSKSLPGYTCCRYAGQINQLVARFSPLSMLDYGSGKGYQYLTRRIHERWGGLLPHCYDPGVRQLCERPQGKFDGVMCVDVMEHIAEPDIEAVVSDLLGFARKFAFIAVSCRPSKKNFPDGTNLHKTIRPPEWWEERVRPLVPDNIVLTTAYEQPE